MLAGILFALELFFIGVFVGVKLNFCKDVVIKISKNSNVFRPICRATYLLKKN